MKLLHIADIHIGKRVSEFSLLDDQRFVLTQIINLVRAHHIDAILVAGDVYDKSLPSADAVALVDWFFSKLAETGVPAIVIAGNHDSAERIAYAGSVLARQGIHVTPVYDGNLTPVVLSDEFGPVQLWPVPFMRPATVRHFFPDAKVDTYTDAFRVALGACALDPQARQVAIAHQFMTAQGSTTERSDSEVSVGGLDKVDVHVFDAFDYVALDHIHRPQRVGCDTVRYAGSPLKYSFSEVNDIKSAVEVELGAPGTMPRCTLIPLKPLHDLRRIKGPLERLIDPEVSASADANDYLHVILTDENPALDAMARLRAVYPQIMGVEYDNARTQAAGLEVDGEIPTSEAISPLELFEHFYEMQNGAQLSEEQCTLVIQEFERSGVSHAAL